MIQQIKGNVSNTTLATWCRNKDHIWNSIKKDNFKCRENE